MYSTFQAWCTPKIGDWRYKDGFAEQMDRDVINPAIKAIESFVVGSYLAWQDCFLTPSPSLIKSEAIPEGWDSTVRYNSRGECKTGQLIEPVLPYKNDSEPDGVGSVVNPEYSLPGVIVFAHNNPFGGFTSKVKRWEDDDRIHLEVTVTISDESLFKTGWFRL